MQFRRSGQRDERRRKVLLDDPAADKEKARADGAVNTAAKTDAAAKAYASAAVEDAETRVADLIPTRPLGILVLFLLGLTAVAGVQALYTFAPECQDALGSDAAAAIDLAARGSLHGWLSSLLLGLGSVAAVLIYVIRRHKMDDYRGRYRLWLWCAAALLIASINAVAGLHHALDAAMVHFTGYDFSSPNIGWALAVAALVGGALGLRVLVEVWRSGGATLALLAAGACYAASAALVTLSPLGNPMQAAMACALAASLGHLTLLLALVVYARRVLLEARGRLPVKKKARKRPIEKQTAQKKAAVKSAEDVSRKPAGASERKLKIDPPHNRAAGKAKRSDVDVEVARTAEASDGTDADEHGPAEGSPEWSELPRSERKRIKKLRRRAGV